MTVSKRLRYEILRRDNHTCRYCGLSAPEVKLTVDHVVPTALGGGDEPTNLVTACADCNAGKTSTNPDQPVVDGVSSDALRWAQAMKEAAQVQSAKRMELASYINEFDLDWDEACGASGYWIDDERTWTRTSDPEREYSYAVCDAEGNGLKLFDEPGDAYAFLEQKKSGLRYYRPDDYRRSLESWFNAGIESDVLRKFVFRAAVADKVYFDHKWRYFCGCVWGFLRERQEVASALLAQKEADQ